MNPFMDDKDLQLEAAWGIIANAHGGNWEEASDDWRKAAERWRDEVMPQLSNRQQFTALAGTT